MTNNMKKIYRYEGFDNSGEVFERKDIIFRGIYKDFGDIYREIFNICKVNNLFRLGIIDTKIVKKNIFPELNLELLFQHKRIPFISHPHEWSTEMFKDAAILHLDLFLQLNKYGLILKDWHPLNILFDNSRPIFVDFTSIIPKLLLKDQKYLNLPHIPFYLNNLLNMDNCLIYEMYQRMFIPYFLLPLFLFQQKKYSFARKRIFETTLHTNRITLSEKEVFGSYSIKRLIYKLQKLIHEFKLTGFKRDELIFIKQLKDRVSNMSVSPKDSGYTSYYDNKRENLDYERESGWSKKQKIISDLLKKYKPHTVLDAGCNTGWYSILAAKHKCEVVAVDIDEACVNQLYFKAKENNYLILPLVLDIANYPEDVFSLPYEDNKKIKKINNKYPILQSANKRLQCEMFMMLALFHHLVLGQNKSFSQIISLINKFSLKYLILEFVSIDDPLIQNEPEFFPAYKSNPSNFSSYSMKNLLKELEKFFKKITIIHTDINTRSVIFCEK